MTVQEKVSGCVTGSVVILYQCKVMDFVTNVLEHRDHHISVAVCAAGSAPADLPLHMPSCLWVWLQKRP